MARGISPHRLWVAVFGAVLLMGAVALRAGTTGKIAGVVRDSAVHQRVCEAARAWVESVGWRVVALIESPITGPEGNKEFLLGARLAL